MYAVPSLINGNKNACTVAHNRLLNKQQSKQNKIIIKKRNENGTYSKQNKTVKETTTIIGDGCFGDSLSAEQKKKQKISNKTATA